jgi:hypothetical protein
MDNGKEKEQNSMEVSAEGPIRTWMGHSAGWAEMWRVRRHHQAEDKAQVMEEKGGVVW